MLNELVNWLSKTEVEKPLDLSEYIIQNNDIQKTEADMNIHELHAELTAWEAKVEGEAKSLFSNLKAWVTNEKNKIEQEIAHLTANGYTVNPPPGSPPRI